MRQRLVEEKIEFEEIDVAVNNIRHPTLSFIPSIIIEKDGVEVGRIEEREDKKTQAEIASVIADAGAKELPTEISAPNYRAKWKTAQTTEEKLTILSEILRLI